MAVIASAAVPPIHTVKGLVVFFRAQREKISTLKPLTARIFAAVFSPPKMWNRMRADAQQGIAVLLFRNTQSGQEPIKTENGILTETETEPER